MTARRTKRKPRLVVGGGRAPARQVYDADFGGYIEVRAFPPLKPGDISLNSDVDALPDVAGDITLAPFADGALREVYFEKVSHEVLTAAGSAAVAEAARVLEAGGRLVIETGSGVPLEQVKKALQGAGFQSLRVTRRGFVRITGRLGG